MNAYLLAALVAAGSACLAGCGGAAGLDVPGLGIVSLANETDQGMAPAVIDQFFLVPEGTIDPGSNLLAQPLQPGGVVILGPFPEGNWQGVAVLDSGLQVNFPVTAVVAGEPTTFVLPPP